MKYTEELGVLLLLILLTFLIVPLIAGMIIATLLGLNGLNFHLCTITIATIIWLVCIGYYYWN